MTWQLNTRGNFNILS